MCYNKAAESLYNDPYIYHESQNEHTRNDKLYERFSVCIENAVKELIPVQQILQTYMSQQQEGQDLDLGDAEVGDSEDPELIDGNQEEVESDPFNPEPQDFQSNEPVMENEVPNQEEMMESTDEIHEEPQIESSPILQSPPSVQTSGDFMNNEFKTINTSSASQAQQNPIEDDGVFFPDAAEARQKNIMYK